MVESINGTGIKLSSCQCPKPRIAFRGEQVPAGLEQKPDTFEKKSMSNGKKVAIGLSALLALVIAGFGIKKHINMNNIKKVTNEALDALSKGTYKKSKNAGKTVQETIHNVLGKDSKIVPHTYDVTKEFQAVHVYRDFGGYKDGLVTPSGILNNDIICPKLLNSASTNRPVNGNVPNVKNKVVRLYLDDPVARATGRKTSCILTFISPNQNYTPVQKDVLKLIEHPEKIDSKVFDKICKFMNANNDKGEIILENVGKYENLDYDLILSAIQSMAKNL